MNAHPETHYFFEYNNRCYQKFQKNVTNQIFSSKIILYDFNSRFLDDWRGFRCDMDPKNPTIKESTDGLYSQSTSVYKVKNGNIVRMNTHGSFVSNMFESEGMSHFATVNVTAVLDGQPKSGSKLYFYNFVLFSGIKADSKMLLARYS